MRTRRKRKQPSARSGALLGAFRAALFACAITVAVILLCALLLKWQLFGEGAIPVITSVVKALCAAFAGFAASRGMEGRVWVWTGLSGLMYVLVCFVAFSLIEKTSAFSLGLLADLAMGFIAGIAGGLLRRLKRA